MHATAVEGPWQQVTMDLIGPLPRSTNGNTWVLMMQDRFSKWLEMRPLRKATANAVTQALTENIIYRHGCSRTLVLDNWKQLTSQQLRKTLESFRIHHRITPIHAPHCNPVERTNRVVKTMVSQYVGTKPSKVGCTPGRATIHIQYGHTGINREAYEVVKINLARAFQCQEKHYNLRRRDWKPKIGEEVWKKEYPLSNKTKAFNAKLAPRYVGPLEVKKIISPVIVHLKNKQGKWYKNIHIQDLKPTNNNNNGGKDEETEQGKGV
ncbi:uncharacterized protein LOC116852522 [Odontomachus brunneus]|uniref:uncharacterized protein LOC116852522 n=1 Tax=Odontomachus brunneus TaxID=486640 RepID=UPI0013F1B562|nr:uncharacterized protein LOC116852522 [Odontomachus brunneus]